jgi:hypothetical protein
VRPHSEVAGGQSEPFGFAWPGPHGPQGGIRPIEELRPCLAKAATRAKRGRAAFVKPHPQAVGDRCAADGGAVSGMDGSRCRPATGRGESGGRGARRTAGRSRATWVHCLNRSFGRRRTHCRRRERVFARNHVFTRDRIFSANRGTRRPCRRARNDKLQRARP